MFILCHILVNYLAFIHIFCTVESDIINLKEPVILIFPTQVKSNQTYLIVDEFKNISENRINADSDQIIQNELVFGEFEMWDIGYDLDEYFVFWTVRHEQTFTLYYANMSSQFDAKNNRIIAEKTLNIVYDYEGHYYFSYDWIHNLLYRTNTHKIYVSNIFEMRTEYTIHRTSLDILSLIVYPENSWIIWSEISPDATGIKYTSIMRANEDGTQISVLIDRVSGRADSLTVDFKSKIIVWFDIIKRVLFSCDLNGNNFQVLPEFKTISSAKNIGNLYSFDGFLYFNCFRDYDEIVKSNLICKFDVRTQNLTIALKLENAIYEEGINFRILHESLQSNTSNKCLNSNCTQLCLPINRTNYHCVCPDISTEDICMDRIGKMDQYLTNGKQNDSQTIFSENITLFTLIFSFMFIIMILIVIIILYIKRKNDRIKLMIENEDLNTNSTNGNEDDVHTNEYCEIQYNFIVGSETDKTHEYLAIEGGSEEGKRHEYLAIEGGFEEGKRHEYLAIESGSEEGKRHEYLAIDGSSEEGKRHEYLAIEGDSEQGKRHEYLEILEKI